MNLRIAWLLVLGLATAGRAADERCELHINAEEDGEAVPCRVHLTDPAGKPVAAPRLPFWKDHFCCAGSVTLSLPPGPYRYEIERGPEYQRLAGAFILKPGRDHTLHAPLRRIADLKRRGWYSGDLHVHRPVADVELLMRAEDLHVAPVITWWNARNDWSGRDRPKEVLRRFDGDRFYHVMAGEDERGGGALLFFHLDEPLPFGKTAHEAPSALAFAQAARKRNPRAWVDIEKPFWWDVPVWLASGLVDSVGLAHNHMHRRGVYPGEAWGRPRDERRFPAPQGNGWWTQEIYYHVLNCGPRLPPTAGSASGVLPNPVGHNRVYVHVDGDFTHDKWWDGLRKGNSFVTNGPLLLCRADGHLPGHVFRTEEGKPLALRLDLWLAGNDHVRHVELVHNGRVVQRLEVEGTAPWRQPASLTVRESGWFLARAVADNKETFRFASTAPFYVEVGKDGRRVSRKSVRFFQDWVAERTPSVEKALASAPGRDAVLETHRRAAKYWNDLADKANAD